MTNTIQKKFKVSSTQLLYQSCPYQAITLFVIGPFLDGLLTNKNVFAFKYTPQVLVRIETLTRNSPTPSPQKKSFFTPFCNFVFLFNLTILCVVFIAVLHCSILRDFCLCKLQYISGYWKDICSHLSGPWTSENLPSFGLWLCSTSWPI